MSEGKVGIILVNTSNLGIDYGSDPVGCGNIQHSSNVLFIKEFLSDKIFSTMDGRKKGRKEGELIASH
ncbi:hypothetical protein ACLOJK_019693 [Asimina triloba]